MKYKDLVNEMYDFGKPKKIIEKKKLIKKYTISEDIKKSIWH